MAFKNVKAVLDFSRDYYRNERKDELISWANKAAPSQFVLHDACLELGVFVGIVIPSFIATYYGVIGLTKAALWTYDKYLDVKEKVKSRKYRTDEMKRILETELNDVELGGFRV